MPLHVPARITANSRAPCQLRPRRRMWVHSSAGCLDLQLSCRPSDSDRGPMHAPFPGYLARRVSAGALLDEVGLTAVAVMPNVQRREAGEDADSAVGPV